MADKTFEAISRRGRTGAKSACPLCGQPNAGSIQVQVLSSTGGRKPKMVRSISKRLCERHTVELYEAVDEAWTRFLGVSDG